MKFSDINRLWSLKTNAIHIFGRLGMWYALRNDYLNVVTPPPSQETAIRPRASRDVGISDSSSGGLGSYIKTSYLFYWTYFNHAITCSYDYVEKQPGPLVSRI